MLYTIDKFRYMQIHPKTIDLSTRLRGINPSNYSPQPRAEVYCLALILIYWNWSIWSLCGPMFQSLQPVLGGNITVCLRMCCWKNPDRKTLVKLRISNRKLNIETGWYDRISRCDRICPVCSLDIEDEIHFLFDCAKYSSIRDDFF